MVRKGIIDFSAFLNKNRDVIIKELSVIDIESKCVQHWMFQPPQDDYHLGPWNDKSSEYRNAWMSTHLHGLYYTGGFTLYESLPSILMHICRSIEVLYTPTAEKANVLQDIFGQERAVIGLESMGCPPAKQTRLFDMDRSSDGNESSSCLFHELYAPGFYCTQSAVQSLARWCAEHPDKVDMNKAENRVKTFGNWQLTAAPSPQQLADQGFIHIAGTKDSVKCLYCGIILHHWKAEDNPVEDHEFSSPFCQFVRYRVQQQRHKGEAAEKNSKEGQDVCGCREMAEITENELYNLCYT